jgi:hypothetical protein
MEDDKWNLSSKLAFPKKQSNLDLCPLLLHHVNLALDEGNSFNPIPYIAN